MVDFFKGVECENIVLELSAGKKECTAGTIELLKANTVDAAQEKHVPVVSEEDGKVRVKVGEVEHPMLPEHHIEWIYVKTTFGGIYCNLEVGDPPEALLNIKPDEVEAVYEYCNLHGLWKAPDSAIIEFGLNFDQNTVACSPEFAAGCVDPSVE
ncbi:desulfoferrodoxin [Ruminococcaceae bacterium OttesenSCG-928-A16]|nr:desulfoferrodoxin [Ruminococcaceae bacterium OttesenSCG-928-A16]